MSRDAIHIFKEPSLCMEFQIKMEFVGYAFSKGCLNCAAKFLWIQSIFLNFKETSFSNFTKDKKWVSSFALEISMLTAKFPAETSSQLADALKKLKIEAMKLMNLIYK